LTAERIALYYENMLTNLKLIFVHGVNEQTTNYSKQLYKLILTELEKKGYKRAEIEKIVQHEVLWANVTTDLTNRYQQLVSYEKKSSFPLLILFFLFPLWASLFLIKIPYVKKQLAPWLRQRLISGIDPLAIQIMQYIKDKGETKVNKANILHELDQDIKDVFSNEDIGHDSLPGEGKNVIIVAHSLGSVIAFDYVMRFIKEIALPEDITVKSFITMGSPIAVFTSSMGHPDSDLKLPKNVERWVNILNPLDGIARPLTDFFRNLKPKEELEQKFVYFGYDPIGAHTGYWNDKKTAQIIAKEVSKALGV
jgi:hypothetical protein